jgi:hypothetical protein
MIFGVFLGAAVLLAITRDRGIAYLLARTMADRCTEGLAPALGTAVPVRDLVGSRVRSSRRLVQASGVRANDMVG